MRPTPSDLVRDYGPLVSSLAFQFFGRADLAREAAQEAWSEILSALPKFDGRSAISTWIHTVAWRRILKFKVSEKRHELEELEERYHRESVTSRAPDSPDVRLWVEDTCRNCMLGVLFCLSSRQRLAFLLRETGALSYADVAGILSTTPENARQLFSRSKKLLSRFMTGNCAHVRHRATCAYGMTPWIQTTAVDQAFERLRKFPSHVEAFRLLPQALPGPNYWESLIFPAS